MARNPAEHIPVKERRERVAEIAPETRLHEILETIFRRMPRVEWVEVTHGTTEYGKDLLVCTSGAFGGYEYTAVVVKLGKISGAAAGSASLGTVKRQVEQAAKVPHFSSRLKGEVRPNQILVVCTDLISSHAVREIKETAPTDFVNVTFWTGQELEERLYEFYPEFFVDLQPEVAEYLARFCDAHGSVSAEHKRLGGQSTRSLAEIFVEPVLIHFDDLEPRVSGERVKLGPTKLVIESVARMATFDSTALKRPKRNVFVMGPPGCGKSTVIRKAAHDLATEFYGGSKDVPLPLYATAKSLAEHVTGDPTIGALIRAIPACSSFDADQLKERLASKDSVLFLDGLDEIATGDGLLTALGAAVAAYPKMRVVCATRLSYFQKPREFPGFRQALMLPMNLRAMQELIEKILGRNSKSVGVLRALVDNGLHLKLPQTPLVVTILALLHEHEQLDEVPANIADLYDMVVQVYLGRWSPGSWGGSGADEYSVKMEVLKRLALAMHESKRSTVSMDEFRELLNGYMQDRGYSAVVNHALSSLLGPSSLLAEIHSRDGVDSQISFVHHSFQEYLAARRLDDIREPLGDLVAQFSDPWWANVITFFAGVRKDVPQIIDAIIDAGVPAQPLSALATGMQFGHLLQAASQSPLEQKERGCLHGADLMQFFYSTYAAMQSKKKVSIHFGRLQMMFSLAVLYGMSYGSQHLAEAEWRALNRLQNSFDAAKGDDRFLEGLRFVCVAAALADRGDWGGVELFVEAARGGDFALLQTAAMILESFTPPESERGRWQKTVRSIRKFAPKGGIEALKRVDRKLRPLDETPDLLGVDGDGDPAAGSNAE